MANNTIAYGFVNLEHLFAERVSGAGEGVVYDTVKLTAAEQTRSINALMASLVEPTEEYSERFYLPGVGTLQPLDEHGNPLPIAEGGYYDIAFPIQGGGTAWGTNRISRNLMTVEEANRQTVEALKKDADWVARHALAALLDNATWTYDDKDKGSLVIQPLANADTVTYVRHGGAASTDDHYLAQAAAIADAANPFPTIHAELMEHPSNSGPVVVYVASSLTSAIQALTGFVEVNDPDILKGDNADRLNSVIDRGLGDEVLGKVDKCWIVEWRRLPAGYMIGHAQGSGPVLGLREYPAAALKGILHGEPQPGRQFARNADDPLRRVWRAQPHRGVGVLRGRSCLHDPDRIRCTVAGVRGD